MILVHEATVAIILAVTENRFSKQWRQLVNTHERKGRREVDIT